MHFQYCSQPPVNHVSWKSRSPVQKWWNLGVAGLHLQIDPLIKGSGEMYLQDHRQVYVFYMLLISQGTGPWRHAFPVPYEGPLKYLLATEVHTTSSSPQQCMIQWSGDTLFILLAFMAKWSHPGVWRVQWGWSCNKSAETRKVHTSGNPWSCGDQLCYISFLYGPLGCCCHPTISSGRTWRRGSKNSCISTTHSHTTCDHCCLNSTSNAMPNHLTSPTSGISSCDHWDHTL